jgi:hypothetical protein
MKGTLSGSASPVEWTQCAVVNFQGWQVTAKIRTRYTGSLTELYLSLSSLDGIETTIGYDPMDFELLAVVPQKADANTAISTVAGQVRIQSQGDNEIGIKLTNRNNRRHDIALTISQRSNQLYQNTITINK